MDPVLAELRKIPPVTRFLTLSLIGFTGAARLNLVFRGRLGYVQNFVFFKYEFWRLYTSFFIGRYSVLFIFDFRTAKQLENGPYALKAGDLVWQLFFAAAAIILASYPVTPASFPVQPISFFHLFLLCIVYLCSMLTPPGAQTSFFGLITFPVQYLPYVMLGMDLLEGGPAGAIRSIPGAIIGHLWWWGVWKTRTSEAKGEAPKWLAKWFGDRSGSLAEGGPGSMGTGIQVIPPRSRTQPASGSWRGNGQRLGSSSN
uniref:Derlin n=1 Tax=Moniliophthora roreri TaxID=221103 RepID=A0A0W0FFS2_MONRR